LAVELCGARGGVIAVNCCGVKVYGAQEAPEAGRLRRVKAPSLNLRLIWAVTAKSGRFAAQIRAVTTTNPGGLAK